MNHWHMLSCEQVQFDKPNCRYMQIDHHVGAFRVTVLLGLTTTDENNSILLIP